MSKNLNTWIVLLNFNGANDTLECISSLQSASSDFQGIILVDNCSTDDSLAVIESYFKNTGFDYRRFDSPSAAFAAPSPTERLILILSDSNNGYGHGNNIGIRYALKSQADYVLVLNNDTVVKNDFLRPLVSCCMQDPSVGIVSPKIFFHHEKDRIWFNGGNFNPLLGKATHANFNEIDVGQKPPSRLTFSTGCAWLLPRQVIEDVGLINETYFMYVEDLEYCHRVLAAGYTLRVAQESHIWHKVGSSTGGNLSSFSVYWRTRNMVRFLRSLEMGPLSTLLAITIFNLRQSTNLVRNGKFNLLGTQAKALVNGLLQPPT